MKIALHWKILIGLILGLVWALISSHMAWSTFTLNWIAPFGEIFINLLKLIAVPLVLFSIISGVAGLGDPSNLGRLGIKTLAFYFLTTFLAIALGLVLVNLIAPGKLIDEETRIDNRITYELWAADNNITPKDGKSFLLDPTYADAVERAKINSQAAVAETDVLEKMQIAEEAKSAGPLDFFVKLVPSNIFSALGNNGSMLQVIFFALFFGIALIFIPQDRGEPVKKVVDGLMEVLLKMVDLIMQAAPFFVFALLAGTVSKMAGDDISKVLEIFKGLSWYSLTVFIGLAIMVTLFYPLILKLFVKVIPYKSFFKAMSPAQTLAFSTSSSAATLPVTMECVEDNLGVDSKVTSFVLPIGATVNMDGTSLYQAVAVVFLAQLHYVDLSLGQQLTIVLTAALASIGSAAVPSAGLVMLIIVLQSVELNPLWIAIILPVDRILDMCRTVVNVTGDATVSSVIAKGENLLHYPPKHSSDDTFEPDVNI
jgi:Na+/H+-dicarboxylate symporter